MRPKAYGGREPWFDAFPGGGRNREGVRFQASVRQRVNQWMLSCADPQAQDDVWGGDQQALICASYAPAVLAETVPDGWSQPGNSAGPVVATTPAGCFAEPF